MVNRSPRHALSTTARIRVDREFMRLIHPLSMSERQDLEANLLSSGRARDPLVTWSGLLLDGHHRLELCRCHRLPFTIVSVDLPSRTAAKTWIIRNQFGRRNLQAFARI